MIPKLRRWLRTAAIREGDDRDRFTIKMRDDDPKWAEAVVDGVLKDTVRRFKAEASTASGLAALRSGANVDDIGQKESAVRKELKELEQTYARPFDADVRQRYQALKEELNKLEFEHVDAGFALFANLGGVFQDDSVKVIEEARVEKRRAGYGWFTLIAAGGAGSMAGLIGFLIQRIGSVITSLGPRTGGKPPIISQHPPAKPPPLSGSSLPAVQLSN